MKISLPIFENLSYGSERRIRYHVTKLFNVEDDILQQQQTKNKKKQKNKKTKKEEEEEERKKESTIDLNDVKNNE